jgi:hypothetical protein
MLLYQISFVTIAMDTARQCELVPFLSYAMKIRDTRTSFFVRSQN